MSNQDDFSELRDQLHHRADRTRPTRDLVAGSVARAHRIRIRRTIVATVTAVVVAGGGIAGATALRGTWGGGDVPVAGVTATPTEPSGDPTAPPSPRVESASPLSTASSPATPPSVDPTASGGSQSTPPPPPPPPRTTTHAPPPPTNSPSTSDRAPLCTAAGTTVEATVGQGAAGHIEYVITVTNTGTAACTVRGYPGVSIVAGDDGTQVGAPADRTPEYVAPKTITLPPRAKAVSSLLVAQADNYGSECEPVDGRGFRIYLPEERAAQFAPIKVRGCANPDIHLMQVGHFLRG